MINENMLTVLIRLWTCFYRTCPGYVQAMIAPGLFKAAANIQRESTRAGWH